MYQDLLDLVFLDRKRLAGAASDSSPPNVAYGQPSSTATSRTARRDLNPEYRDRVYMASDGDDKSGTAATCPVDHKSREVWLSQARAAAAANGGGSSNTHTPTITPTSTPTAASPSASSWNPMSWRIPFSSQPAPPTNQQQHQHSPAARPGLLDESRVVSSIPRSTAGAGVSDSSAYPSNHENETGADAATGNWVYPSEKMFFEALKRKGNAGGADGARPADMRTVVPIHNAVNERAWKEIKEWEAPYLGEGKCGGPKLESFSGLATKMSPKARINTWLGYTAPFDRHDWVVDRCGTRVEYVIDFYAGRPSGSSPSSPTQQKLNFYLDVRPKLNTWEGVKMRALRAIGAV